MISPVSQNCHSLAYSQAKLLSETRIQIPYNAHEPYLIWTLSASLAISFPNLLLTHHPLALLVFLPSS